jgi:hypothetical protein
MSYIDNKNNINKQKNLKLILYRDCKKIELIEEVNTKKGMEIIMVKVEQWKKKNKKRNTVEIIIGK